MKKMSYWAKSNPVKARWLIALATTLLVTLGIEVGFGFAAWDIEIPLFVTTLLVSSLLITMILFPRKTSYLISRRFHFAVCMGTFLCAICFGNLFMFEVDRMPDPVPQVNEQAIFHPVNQKAPALEKNPKTILTVGLLQFRSVKKRTKALKGKVKQLRNRYRNLPRGLAFFLFILASFGAFMLGYGITALACLFACSEAGALAVLFAIIALGFFLGSLFFLGYAFYRLFEKRDKGNPAPPPPTENKNSKG